MPKAKQACAKPAEWDSIIEDILASWEQTSRLHKALLYPNAPGFEWDKLNDLFITYRKAWMETHGGVQKLLKLLNDTSPLSPAERARIAGKLLSCMLLDHSLAEMLKGAYEAFSGFKLTWHPGGLPQTPRPVATQAH